MSASAVAPRKLVQKNTLLIVEVSALPKRAKASCTPVILPTRYCRAIPTRPGTESAASGPDWSRRAHRSRSRPRRRRACPRAARARGPIEFAPRLIRLRREHPRVARDGADDPENVVLSIANICASLSRVSRTSVARSVKRRRCRRGFGCTRRLPRQLPRGIHRRACPTWRTWTVPDAPALDVFALDVFFATDVFALDVFATDDLAAERLGRRLGGRRLESLGRLGSARARAYVAARDCALSRVARRLGMCVCVFLSAPTEFFFFHISHVATHLRQHQPEGDGDGPTPQARGLATQLQLVDALRLQRVGWAQALFLLVHHFFFNAGRAAAAAAALVCPALPIVLLRRRRTAAVAALALVCPGAAACSFAAAADRCCCCARACLPRVAACSFAAAANCCCRSSISLFRLPVLIAIPSVVRSSAEGWPTSPVARRTSPVARRTSPFARRTAPFARAPRGRRLRAFAFAASVLATYPLTAFAINWLTMRRLSS